MGRKACVTRLLKNFEEVKFQHIPRASNHIADGLVVLGLKLEEVDPNKKPLTWFACHDELVGSVLP